MRIFSPWIQVAREKYHFSNHLEKNLIAKTQTFDITTRKNLYGYLLGATMSHHSYFQGVKVVHQYLDVLHVFAQTINTDSEPKSQIGGCYYHCLSQFLSLLGMRVVHKR